MSAPALPAIAVDTTFFGHEEARNRRLSLSTSIFTADLLDAFGRMGLAGHFTLIVSYSHEAFFRERFPAYRLLVVRWQPLTLAYRLSGGRLAATKYLKRLGIYRRTVEQHGLDLIWFPAVLSEEYYVHTGLRGIVTMHDLYRLHQRNNPEAYREIADAEKNQIVAISSFTRQDIATMLGYAGEIPVIPNSIRFDASETEPVPRVAGRFILDINAYLPKKNTITLLRAFALIKDRTDCGLVCCGGYKDDAYFSELEDFIRQNAMEARVHLLVRIPEAQRNWLLRNAALFVTPSLYEGFGRTPVEAAVCGVPVLSTRETSLYEATMGLVHYYEDATSAEKLAEAMLAVIQNPDAPETLRQISEALLCQYRPERCAERYWDIFQAAARKQKLG